MYNLAGFRTILQLPMVSWPAKILYRNISVLMDNINYNVCYITWLRKKRNMFRWFQQRLHDVIRTAKLRKYFAMNSNSVHVRISTNENLVFTCVLRTYTTSGVSPLCEFKQLATVNCSISRPITFFYLVSNCPSIPQKD